MLLASSFFAIFLLSSSSLCFLLSSSPPAHSTDHLYPPIVSFLPGSSLLVSGQGQDLGVRNFNLNRKTTGQSVPYCKLKSRMGMRRRRRRKKEEEGAGRRNRKTAEGLRQTSYSLTVSVSSPPPIPVECLLQVKLNKAVFYSIFLQFFLTPGGPRNIGRTCCAS